MNSNQTKNKKMKVNQILGQIKLRISLVSLLLVVAVVVLSCSADNGAAVTGPDTRLEGKDKVLVFHNNPNTTKPYTSTETNSIGYDPAKEERYNQCQPIKLAIWTQQKPEKIVVTKQGSKEEVTNIVNFIRNDRPEASDYKEGYGYEGTWITTPASLGIKANESATYDITVTYNDVGIDGFMTPSVRSTTFKISYYDDGKACIDLNKDLVGDWRFDLATDLTKATKGKNLVLAGGKIQTAVEGITATDGASLIDLGSWYEMNHGLSATGGGTKVNDYTLIMDINVPSTSAGHYVNLLQPREANDADGSLYINPSLGFWFNGGPSSWAGTIRVNTWHRIVISKESPNLLLYVDGVEIMSSPTLGSLDGKNALSTAKLLLFADNGGEDYPIKVSQVMLFNKGFIGDHIKKFPKVGVQF
jgi:hypothetical protein